LELRPYTPTPLVLRPNTLAALVPVGDDSLHILHDHPQAAALALVDVDRGPDGYLYLTYRGVEAVAVEALRDLRGEKDREIAELRAEIEALKGLNVSGEMARPKGS
jgi:hypothetical protein